MLLTTRLDEVHIFRHDIKKLTVAEIKLVHNYVLRNFNNLLFMVDLYIKDCTYMVSVIWQL